MDQLGQVRSCRPRACTQPIATATEEEAEKDKRVPHRCGPFPARLPEPRPPPCAPLFPCAHLPPSFTLLHSLSPRLESPSTRASSSKTAHHAWPPSPGGGSFVGDGGRPGPVRRVTVGRGAAGRPSPRGCWVCNRHARLVRAAPLLSRRRCEIVGVAVPPYEVRRTDGHSHGLVDWPSRGAANVPGTHKGELHCCRPDGCRHH